MGKGLIEQARRHWAIVTNASTLVGSTLITSGLGFVYWWLASWRCSADALGLGSAAILAMTLLGTFCLFGLGTLLIGELPRQKGQEWSLISTALLVTGCLGGGAGILFALLAPALSANFAPLRASVGSVLCFALGVALTASSLALDQAMIGLLRGNRQLWRNAVFAVTKLIAIYLVGRLMAHKTAMTIYNTWTIGSLCSLLMVGIYMITKERESIKYCFRMRWGWIRRLGMAALQHHMLNITLQLPALALPLIVTMMLSASANARFYIMWMIIGIICVVPIALTTSLYASAATQPELLPHKMRLTLTLAFGIGIVSNLVLFFGAEQILRVFNHAYSEEAVAGLRILSFSIFPTTIMNHFVTIYRLRRKMLAISLPMLFGCLFELGAAALGAHIGGLLGLSLWWLIAKCIETACMLPTVCGVAWPVPAKPAPLTLAGAVESVTSPVPVSVMAGRNTRLTNMRSLSECS